jgi:hypothetical protein
MMNKRNKKRKKKEAHLYIGWVISEEGPIPCRENDVVMVEG